MKGAILTTLAAIALQGNMPTTEIVQRTAPAVVTVRSSTSAGISSGSGFIVDLSGTIVTNLHVIRGATAISVKLGNGEIYDQVRVRAYDARKDLAVIQIAGFGLPITTFGDSDDAQAGQPVVLIGNPLGVLEGSVSTGVVSGVRMLEGGFRVIQIDAAANPGNSGGPLLNSSGKVIGVLSFKLTDAENLNFAIPANYVRGLLPSTESFGVEELQKRLSGTAIDLFSSEMPRFPTTWKSLMSATTKIIRVDGDHVYIEHVLPSAAKARGDFGITELAKVGDKYVGSTRDGRANGEGKFCRTDEPFEITLLSPTRIEGSAPAHPTGSRFDYGKCQWTKPGVMTPFAWIPQ